MLPDGLSRDQYGHVLVQLREGVSLESRASSRTPGELLFRGPSGEVFEINSDYVQVGTQYLKHACMIKGLILCRECLWASFWHLS